MTRIFANAKYISKISIKYTNRIFALFGFIAMFTPLGDFWGVKTRMGKKIMYSCVVLVCIWIIVVIGSSLYVFFKRKYKLLDVGNGHSVYVQYGDIFSKKEVSKKFSRRNVVIPVNRCFDTIVDDDLISSNTLHGVCMKKLYENNIYTQESLNNEMKRKLNESDFHYEVINIENKRKGNLNRFEPGTILEIKGMGGVNYWFLGLTMFDKSLHAQVSDEEYVLALIKMLKYNNCRSQGFPLVLPLIGAGAANTKKEERDILEYLVKLIKMNRKIVNCDVHIVVRSVEKNRIAIVDL